MNWYFHEAMARDRMRDVAREAERRRALGGMNRPGLRRSRVNGIAWLTRQLTLLAVA